MHQTLVGRILAVTSSPDPPPGAGESRGRRDSHRDRCAVVGTAHAITARAVAVSNDVERDPRYLTNQQDSGSELIVAILAIGRVVGTLDIEDDEVGAFDGAAIARYESVAGRAARALG